MKTKYFAYKRGREVLPVKTKSIEPVIHNTFRVVVTIVGKYNSMISGLHLGLYEVVSYHSTDFNPNGLVIGNAEPVSLKKIKECDRYHVYQTPIPPSSSVITVTEEFEVDDFIFQVGVRHAKPYVITVGVIERITKYVGLDHVLDSVEDGSESGSGVFDYDGKLIGMTLGHLTPDVMVAQSISSLIDENSVWDSRPHSNLLSWNTLTTSE